MIQQAGMKNNGQQNANLNLDFQYEPRNKAPANKEIPLI